MYTNGRIRRTPWKDTKERGEQKCVRESVRTTPPKRLHWNPPEKALSVCTQYTAESEIEEYRPTITYYNMADTINLCHSEKVSLDRFSISIH